MRTQLYYNREKLRKYVKDTGKSTTDIAQIIGASRVQVSRALNKRGASPTLVQTIVAVANRLHAEQAKSRALPFEPMDWRTLLSENAPSEKILQKIVS